MNMINMEPLSKIEMYSSFQHPLSEQRKAKQFKSSQSLTIQITN